MSVAAHADLVRVFLRFPRLWFVEAKMPETTLKLEPCSTFFHQHRMPTIDLHVFNHIGVALEATSHLKWKSLTSLTL